MTLDDDTLERFAIIVSDLPPPQADEEYRRLIAEYEAKQNISD